MKFNKAGLLVMVLVFLLGWVKGVWADDDDLDSDIAGLKQTDFIKERSYIGIVGISADIDQWGDFNGGGVLTFNQGSTVATPETDFIPAITRQFGWGVLLGHREGPWAGEVSFWRSDHTGTYIIPASLGGPTTVNTPASLQAINIDFKRYFFTQFPTQPFVSLGMSFPWLWVQGASYGSYQSDETISGIGLNLGVGMELYLDNNFSILGGLYQRWGQFDQVNGASKIPLNQMTFDGNNSDVGALTGNGLNFYIGGTVGFE